MKKKSNYMTKHHIIPTSRGGSNLEKNLAHVPLKQHESYHTLFGNKLPDEIIDYLVKDFWNNQDWVNKYQQKYQK